MTNEEAAQFWANNMGGRVRCQVDNREGTVRLVHRPNKVVGVTFDGESRVALFHLKTSLIKMI
jgi:hypothetical protein